MSIEFRFAATHEYPRISAFLDEYWAKGHIYVRKPELFEWTFRRPGFWDAGQYSFSLAEDNGELVGILGGIPYDLNFRGTRRRGVWIVNFAVRPDYRKGAAALRLLSTFRNSAFPVVIASGLNEATVAIYKVLRGQVLPEPPRHVAVLPSAIDRMSTLIQAAHPDWDEPRASSLARFFEWPVIPSPPGEVGRQLPTSWDEVDWPRIAAETVGACRDLNYLNWRYLNHPCFSYRVLTVPEGASTGLLIWRLETASHIVDGQRTDLDRVGRVVEFLPASPANATRLLAALQADLLQQDALGADFYNYNAGCLQTLDHHQFRSTLLHPDGHSIPTRLQPIDPGGGMLNAIFADPDLPPCDLSSTCPWYWTKSDSDQDRPN